MLGRGEMSIEAKEVEIWTRLLIQVDEGWLEVFNALDENGYAFHAERPAGIFVPCIATSYTHPSMHDIPSRAPTSGSATG